MFKDPTIEKLREVVQADRLRPAKEFVQQMIDDGLIDEHGRVLLLGPEPAEEETTVPADQNGDARD